MTCHPGSCACKWCVTEGFHCHTCNLGCHINCKKRGTS
jgi:hypothetical protein